MAFGREGELLDGEEVLDLLPSYVDTDNIAQRRSLLRILPYPFKLIAIVQVDLSSADDDDADPGALSAEDTAEQFRHIARVGRFGNGKLFHRLLHQNLRSGAVDYRIFGGGGGQGNLTATSAALVDQHGGGEAYGQFDIFGLSAGRPLWFPQVEQNNQIVIGLTLELSHR